MCPAAGLVRRTCDPCFSLKNADLNVRPDTISCPQRVRTVSGGHEMSRSVRRSHKFPTDRTPVDAHPLAACTAPTSLRFPGIRIMIDFPKDVTAMTWHGDDCIVPEKRTEHERECAMARATRLGQRQDLASVPWPYHGPDRDTRSDRNWRSTCPAFPSSHSYSPRSLPSP